MKAKTMRRALFTSILSLLLCVSMLVGTTFAWFTDEVVSGNNLITAGNLDVELYYMAEGQTGWTKVDANTNIFMENALWEPGHTEVVKLKVVNEGTLALKYQLGVNVASETSSVNVAGKEFKLSDYIKFGVVEGAQTYTREQAVAAVDANATALNVAYNAPTAKLLPKTDNATTANANEAVVTLVVYMPTSVDNVANHAKDAAVPTINLGINLFATQLEAESDSFGPDYDAQAPKLTVEVTPNNIQEYLDGQHGDLSNVTLKLTAGNYGVLYLGRPTKYAGSNTEYYCGTHDFTTDDAEAFKAHLAEAGYHTTPKYATTLKDLTIQGVPGATVAGVLVTTGHSYGDVYDYVLDKDYDSGSAYYSTLTMKNVTFKNVAFSGEVDINTSDADTVYDGVTFDGCSFTTGGTDSSNGAAIRYYNESNNGQVRNITVKNSTFTNCYQGVYVHHVNGVTITGNTFDTTGHNAIALQNHAGAIDLKKVVISNNAFENIGDRVVRFGDIGADSDITMEYNVATNSGDDADEAMRATKIAAGVKVNANYNSWDGTVVNPELRDTKTGTMANDVDSMKSAIATGGDIIVTGDIAIDTISSYDFSTGGYTGIAAAATINGNGNSIVRESGNGNALMVSTTEKVTFENVVFESTKGSAVLATRKEGANIEVNDCVFQNNAAPSTGNTGVQVHASNVTMTFNGCTFNNMPIVTSSSYPEGIELVFNDCTFNWTGDNCPGFIQIANNLKITVDLNNCKMNYTTDSQYDTAKTMISYNWPDACTINIDGLKVTGTRNNDKIWKICSSNNAVTINTTGELSYIFNAEAVDFATYLK